MHVGNELTYELFRRELLVKGCAEFALPIPRAELEEAAWRFLDFLTLPQEIKNAFSIMADPKNDRGSDSGYKIAQRSAGKTDNKELFNFRGVTDQLLYATVCKYGIDSRVQRFLKSARELHHACYMAFYDLAVMLGSHHPGLGIKLLSNSSRTHCLRFVKYDSAAKGEMLAKTHYDRGFCALAIGESAPGLRIGKDEGSLAPVERNGHTAIFMPGYTFPRDIGSDEFKPAYHDVIQTEDAPLAPGIARWAIIYFVDTYSDNSITYADTHTAIKTGA